MTKIGKITMLLSLTVPLAFSSGCMDAADADVAPGASADVEANAQDQADIDVSAAPDEKLAGAPRAACKVKSDGKLYCGNKYKAGIWFGPTYSIEKIDELWTTYSWFSCWITGDVHSGGNTTWYWTKGDKNHKWGFVAAGDMFTSSAFDANPSAYGLEYCQD